MIVQQSLARLFNSRWHNCSTVTGMIVEQSLVQLFNSGWHDSSTVTGTIVQQWLARIFNSGWHDSHGQEFFFFLCWQNSSTVMFNFNRAMFQEYDTWSHLQWLLLPFAPTDIFYSNTVCNKSTAEAWICLVSFYGGAKDFIFTCIFVKIITFFIKI